MKVTGADKVAKNLARYQREVQRDAVSILKQEARALCVELGSATNPGPGFDEMKSHKFRGRVDGDVRKVFASKQDPSSIMALMRVHAPHMAGAYWHAVKSGKSRAALEIMRRANLPEGINPAHHKAARIGKKGRVPGPVRPVSIATEPQVARFSREQAALVGMAKAGWYAAAKALGGRVRRNIVGLGGKRMTEEIFSASVRKLARRFSGLGGARISGGEDRPRVEVFTNVKHATNALPHGMYLSAVLRAEEKVVAALKHSGAALRKKVFGKAG